MRNTRKNRRRYHGSYTLFKAEKLIGAILKIMLFLVLVGIALQCFPLIVVVAIILWILHR